MDCPSLVPILLWVWEKVLSCARSSNNWIITPLYIASKERISEGIGACLSSIDLHLTKLLNEFGNIELGFLI